MVRENTTKKKTRYISIALDGAETYVENISASGSMKDHVPAVKLRLREIQRLMPLGKWTAKIEQQWPEKGARHYQSLDVVSGKMEESVL